MQGGGKWQLNFVNTQKGNMMGNTAKLAYIAINYKNGVIRVIFAR
jgi:hypothetical protein